MPFFLQWDKVKTLTQRYIVHLTFSRHLYISICEHCPHAPRSSQLLFHCSLWTQCASPQKSAEDWVAFLVVLLCAAWLWCFRLVTTIHTVNVTQPCCFNGVKNGMLVSNVSSLEVMSFSSPHTNLEPDICTSLDLLLFTSHDFSPAWSFYCHSNPGLSCGSLSSFFISIVKA